MPTVQNSIFVNIFQNFPHRFSFGILLFVRPEGKRPLGRSRRRWEDNIKMDLREIGIDGANLIQLA
jgi:hypothetical protein